MDIGKRQKSFKKFMQNNLAMGRHRVMSPLTSVYTPRIMVTYVAPCLCFQQCDCHEAIGSNRLMTLKCKEGTRGGVGRGGHLRTDIINSCLATNSLETEHLWNHLPTTTATQTLDSTCNQVQRVLTKKKCKY